MIAYEVRVNGKKVATVGLRDDGVLSLIANWVSRPKSVTSKTAKDWEAGFTVGGLRSGRRGFDEFLTWYNKTLRLEDEVAFRLIETDRVDRPRKIMRRRQKANLNAAKLVPVKPPRSSATRK